MSKGRISKEGAPEQSFDQCAMPARPQGAAVPLTPETMADSVGQSMVSIAPGKRRLTIVTGGQTGVDRAALDIALDLKLPIRGWCPLGRAAEDGPIDARYPLQECSSANPAVRTELNAIESDGTLLLSHGSHHTDGTNLTRERALAHGRPLLELSLDDPAFPEKFWSWIREKDIRALNVAGPRESQATDGRGIYDPARQVLRQLLDPSS